MCKTFAQQTRLQFDYFGLSRNAKKILQCQPKSIQLDHFKSTSSPKFNKENILFPLPWRMHYSTNVIVPILFDCLIILSLTNKVEAAASDLMQMWRYCDTGRKKMQIYIFCFQIEISSHSLQFQNVTDHSVQAREKKTDSNLWQLRDQVKCLVLKKKHIPYMYLSTLSITTGWAIRKL